MRIPLVLSFVFALTGPAVGQVPYVTSDPADNLRWMEQEAQRHRLQQLERDLNTLDNRLRTEENLRSLDRQRYETARARANVERSLSTARVAPRRTSDIPDELLARSNQRVREASKN
jgi:hypothetical protein